ncbi:MAG: ATP-binding cassette domain-containing protein [Oscillospiraceae bacterium]|nr:ATP-binding cassette domain-containing protein [Oscillospiraceae bacterium]
MLKLENICYSVDEDDSGKEIIKGLNLSLGSGKFLAVTGPNGGGKSTTAKLIMGIEKPTSGKIIFENQDITDMSITDRARLGIGFAFQQPVRFKGIRIIDLLRIAAGKELSVSDACVYLSEVGLCAKDYINREVNSSLSGGEIKRIEIAGIAAKNSKLSVFDEPEAGIDIWSFNNLIKVFEHMHEDKSKSIVVISHQERILNIADEIAVIANGEIVSYGTRDEILPQIKGTPSVANICRGNTFRKRGQNL